MEFQEFVDEIKKGMESAYSVSAPGTSIRQQPIEKLQGESYTALTVTQPGSSMGVNINMDALYDAMLNDVSFDSLLDRAMETVDRGLAQAPAFDPAQLSNYDYAKNLLVVDVVGTKANEAMLANVPHTDIEDMSMVYRMQIESLNGTALVTNQIMQTWGITTEQLHQNAMETAQMLRPASMKTMSEVMAELMGMPPEMMGDSMAGAPQLYVVTNDEKVRGASALFYPDFMDDCAKRLESNFFVLPSSVHEMLILPDDGIMKNAELEAMVSEVNASEVLPQDQLTDHAYHYDAQEKIFERADKYEERMEAKEKAAEKDTAKEERHSVLDDLRSKKDQIPAKSAAAPQKHKSEQVL